MNVQSERETYFGFVQVGRVFSRALFSCVSSGGMRATPFKVSTGFLGQVVLNVSDVGHVHLVVDRSRVHDDFPSVVRERA